MDFSNIDTLNIGGKAARNLYINGKLVWPFIYDVTWNSNGGSSVASTSVRKGRQIGTLPTTTKSGYDFSGWYTELTGGEKITSSTIISEPSVFYAQWAGKVYTKTRANILSEGSKLTGTNLPKGNYSLEVSGWRVLHTGTHTSHVFYPVLLVRNASDTSKSVLLPMYGTLNLTNSSQVFFANDVPITNDGITKTYRSLKVTNLNETSTPTIRITISSISLPYSSNVVYLYLLDGQVKDCGKVNFTWENSSTVGAKFTRL